jgi:hypothetical protein
MTKIAINEKIDKWHNSKKQETSASLIRITSTRIAFSPVTNNFKTGQNTCSNCVQELNHQQCRATFCEKREAHRWAPHSSQILPIPGTFQVAEEIVKTWELTIGWCNTRYPREKQMWTCLHLIDNDQMSTKSLRQRPSHPSQWNCPVTRISGQFYTWETPTLCLFLKMLSLSTYKQNSTAYSKNCYDFRLPAECPLSLYGPFHLFTWFLLHLLFKPSL